MANSIDALNSRFAVSKFDVTKKLSDDQITLLKDSLRLTPSSMNIQPWKFIFIRDKNLLQKIYDENACHQDQVITCDCLVVVCFRTDINSGYINSWLEEMTRQSGATRESLEGYEKMISGFAEYSNEADKERYARDMAFVALGNMLTVCAIEGIDAGPMAGYDAGKMDELLGLKEKNLKSAVLCAVGVKAEGVASRGKLRWSNENVIMEM